MGCGSHSEKVPPSTDSLQCWMLPEPRACQDFRTGLINRTKILNLPSPPTHLNLCRRFRIFPRACDGEMLLGHRVPIHFATCDGSGRSSCPSKSWPLRQDHLISAAILDEPLNPEVQVLRKSCRWPPPGQKTKPSARGIGAAESGRWLVSWM